MNSFGYDYYTPNDHLYFDESSYTDQIKPLDKIENFSNDIDSLFDTDTNKERDILQQICDQKDQYCNILKQKYKECLMHIQKKNNELNYYNSHTFLLYIILIFAIVFVFYQRSQISNLNQLLYILNWHIKTNCIEKKA